MKKQTRISIEVERVRVAYRTNERFVSFCERCGVETEFISKAEAIALIDARYAEDFHAKFAPDKTLIFCLKSIIENI